MDRRMTVAVGINSDPRTAHIGRYFVDIRDTTRVENPARPNVGRQLRTMIKDADGARLIVSQLRERCIGDGILFHVVHDTCDILDL